MVWLLMLPSFASLASMFLGRTTPEFEDLVSYFLGLNTCMLDESFCLEFRSYTRETFRADGILYGALDTVYEVADTSAPRRHPEDGTWLDVMVQTFGAEKVKGFKKVMPYTIPSAKPELIFMELSLTWYADRKSVDLLHLFPWYGAGLRECSPYGPCGARRALDMLYCSFCQIAYCLLNLESIEFADHTCFKEIWSAS